MRFKIKKTATAAVPRRWGAKIKVDRLLEIS